MNDPPDCPTCELLTLIVQEWVAQRGQARCWYYPDLFREICTALGVDPGHAGERPPRADFEAGCRRYQEEEYGPREDSP